MKTTMKVEGMACMNCAGKVEKALKACEGVQTVDITLATGMVCVEANDDVMEDVLLDAVNATGFEASSVES